MIDSLDIVAVRVKNKCGVVTGMVWTFTRSAIVLATIAQRRTIKSIHHGPVARLKCQMLASSQRALCRLGILCRHHQLINPEEAFASTPNRDIQHLENRCVKPLGSGQVPYYQLNVINQASTVQFHSLHAVLLSV